MDYKLGAMTEDKGTVNILHPLIAKDALDNGEDHSGVDNADSTEFHVRRDVQKVIDACKPRAYKLSLVKVPLPESRQLTWEG